MGRDDRVRSRYSRRSRSRSPSHRPHRRRNERSASRSPRRSNRQGDTHRNYSRRSNDREQYGRYNRRRGDHDNTHSDRDRLPAQSRRTPSAAQAPQLLEPPAVGSIQRACVTSVRPFGVFVRPDGWPQDGLVHASQVSEQCTLSRDDEDCDKIKALEFFAPRNAQVYVKLTDIQDDGSGRLKLACSMKACDQDTGADMDPNNASTIRHRPCGPESDAPPEVGSIHAAVVERVQPFGIFVKLMGFRKWGLVHSSQVSDHLEIMRDDSDESKTAALGSVVTVGESIQVKVVDIVADERGPKVGCSIKLVNQRDGTDLDPNFLKYRPRGDAPDGGRHGPVGTAAGDVKSGAVVEWGHLVGGDTKFVESRGYSLVDDAAGELPPPPPPPRGSNMSQQNLPPPPQGPGPQPAGSPSELKPAAWGGISTMDEALAILANHNKKEKHDKHKKKKSSKHKKEKKHKKSGKDKF